MIRRRCFFRPTLELKANGGEYDSAITLSYSSAASQQQITVRSNRYWHKRVGVTPPSPSWASLNCISGVMGETNVIVSVEKNNTEEARSGRFVISTLNDRGWTVLNVEQAIGQIPTYTITFENGHISPNPDPIQRIDYTVNGVSGYLTDVTTGETIPGTYLQGTVISYTAVSTGYYTIMSAGTVGNKNLLIPISMQEISGDTGDTYFEITAIEARPNYYGWYENCEMPDGQALLHNRCKELTIEYRTNVEGVIPVFSYISGSTNWISGITENEPLNSVTGDNLTFTLTYKDNLSTAILNKAEIHFTNESGSVLATLPILTTVDETEENDFIRISTASTYPNEGELELNVGASGKNITIWTRANTPTKISMSSGLRLYDGITGKEIKTTTPDTGGTEHIGPYSYVIFPTQILSANVMSQRFFPLIISVPKNSDGASKTYSMRFESEYYSELDLSWQDHATITITQAKNETYYSDYYINDFYLIYGTSGYQETALTIPSSAITYHRVAPDFEEAISVIADIRCRQHDAAGTVDNPSYTFTNYLTTSGSGTIVDTSRIDIEFPSWLSSANGIDGTPYSYTPIAGAPWKLNARSNQGYNTGSSRTGDVTVKWKYGTMKQGADSAKTVSITQLYGQIPLELPVYIYSINGTTLPSGTISTASTINAGGSISLVLSAASGAKIVFGSYMGDSTLNGNLTVTVDGKQLQKDTIEGVTYEATSSGLKTVTIADKGNSGTYTANLIGEFSGPTGYSSGYLTITIMRQ